MKIASLEAFSNFLLGHFWYSDPVKNRKANVSDSTQSTLPKEVGFNTVILEEIVRGGPGEPKKAERKARKLAKLYGSAEIRSKQRLSLRGLTS